MGGTADDYRMLTTEALRAAVAGDGAERVLTLDRAFQGLPDTAHGGSVLAAFDLVADRNGPRRLEGHYLRRVPLGAPLRLRAHDAGDGCRLEVLERDAVLVRGLVAGGDGAADGAPGAVVTPPADGARPLPISRSCFACGTDNALGLGVRLRADDDAVGGTWTPRPGFAMDGALAPLALTTLLDEAAFWLGALATGEAGMTTELRVTLHARPAAGAPVSVRGARAAVRARADDPRYLDTVLAACDADGRLVATATITFVAVRGAARRLVTGMLAVNAPDVLRAVFPGYAPA
jgi:hypothetical protein